LKRFICLVGLFLLVSVPAVAQQPPEPLVRGLHNPTAIAAGSDGRVYVCTMGEVGKDGDGAIVAIDKGKATPFAAGLDDPRGIVARGEFLFVADRKRVWRINRQAKASVFAAAGTFAPEPRSLGGIDVDEQGTLYVADAGDGKSGGSIYRIAPNGKVSLVTDEKRSPAMQAPTGLAMDGMSHLVVLDSASGIYYVCGWRTATRKSWPTTSAAAASSGTSTDGSMSAMWLSASSWFPGRMRSRSRWPRAFRPPPDSASLPTVAPSSSPTPRRAP
jgi:sugar lactone lactonase YvrE